MKKIIALICAAALLCTLCVPAFAQNISDQLTEVMLAAKATLGIDDRYSDFTGSQDGDLLEPELVRRQYGIGRCLRHGRHGLQL